jgi:hypothetical protein
MCECGNLRESGPFSGWNDYDKFVRELQNGALFKAVPVKVPHSNVGLKEQWFECSRCKALWRLVEPDPPFAGVWEMVP